MIETDVIVVGGGPAGAACAWRLRQNNIPCIIVDKESFPRLKPCAGWVTHQVLQDLELETSDYPYGLTTFKSFYISFRGVKFKLHTYQHAIRRIEFDDWLLHRSGAPFLLHNVREIVQDKDRYILDGEITGKYLVGAGGTYCPVYRSLFKTTSPRAKEALIVAQEEEFTYDYSDAHCRLWFMENHLTGYAWYVPKANNVVNVGVGGTAEQLNARGDSIKKQWDYLVEKLERMGLVRGHAFKPVAHSYYLRQNLPEVRKGNAFITGDAAGLSTLDMGEGIGPAIKSGLMAADAILHGTDYSVASIPRYSLGAIVRAGWARAPK